MNSEDWSDKKKRYWSKEEAVLNIRKYCAVQERCHQEVRYKLIEHGIYGDVLEEIISDMITEDFLNEERFACTYARGKFRMKQWGRIKIKSELKQKNVSLYCIATALDEIDSKEYADTLQHLIHKKERLSRYKNEYDRVKKLTDYALSKGYEYELVSAILKK